MSEEITKEMKNQIMELHQSGPVEYTHETYKCPKCGQGYTFNMCNGTMILGPGFEEQVAAQGYCARCLVKKLCAKFGIKLEKTEEEH